MAAARKNAGAAKQESKQVVKADPKADQLPSTIDMSKHSGAGLENTDRDSFAIPFLAIIQKGSPQVDKDDEAYMKGVEVGDLLITSSGEVFKDEVGADLIFCSYRRVFTRWAPLDNGGGFKGELPVDEVVSLRAAGKLVEQDNRLYADNGDVVKDTRIHYVLILSPSGGAVPAVLSVSSTQIKKSKMLMTQIQSYVARDSKDKPFTPPSFGHIFHAETIAESNDKGSWRGWKFTRKSFVTDPALFNQAKAFHDTVVGEGVKVDFAHDPNAAAPGASDDKI